MMLLDIPTVAGESESPNGAWANKIQIENMGYGITQSTSNSTGTGLVSGGAEVHELHFSKQMDKSTPYLFLSLAKGSPIPVCYIRVVRSGANSAGGDPNGAQYEAETFTLNDAIFTDYSTSGALGPGGLPMESWSISFKKIVENYVQTDQNGNPVAAGNAVGFDFGQALPV